jgi:predicted outer membrane repeat protein
LRYAVDHATSPGDTISFQFTSPAVINLLGPLPNLTNPGSLSILNQRTGAVTIDAIVNGSTIGPIFDVTSASGPVQIAGQTAPITLEGGQTLGNGGAINDQSASGLSLTQITFADNEALNGGAIYAGAGSGPVDLTGCSFVPDPSTQVPNGAEGVGGAVDYEGSSGLMVTNTTFRGNLAYSGAGGAIYYNGTGNLVMGGNSTFEANRAQSNYGFYSNGSAAGGAIYVAMTHAPSVRIQDTSFLNNVASGSSFNNTSDAFGGAIANFGGSLTITNCQFTGNQATGSDWGRNLFYHGPGGPSGDADGGAIYSSTAEPLKITNGSFVDNSALGGKGGPVGLDTGQGGSARGGAIEDAGSGSGSIVTSFYGNRAIGGDGSGSGTGGAGGVAEGGAFCNLSSGTLEVIAFTPTILTFEANEAVAGDGGAGSSQPGLAGSAFGGGLANLGSMILTDYLFERNSATGGNGFSPNPNYGSGVGGGVYNGGTTGNLTTKNDWFTANVAQNNRNDTQGICDGIGGGLANEAGTVMASSLAFADNIALNYSAQGMADGGAIFTFSLSPGVSFSLSNSRGAGDLPRINGSAVVAVGGTSFVNDAGDV